MVLLAIIPIHSGAAMVRAPARESRRSGTPDPTPLVAIQPMGVVDPALSRCVGARIARLFVVDVVVLPVRPLPESAWYRPRMRYRGGPLVEWLADEKPPPVAALLGLMSRDLSSTKGHIYDWGVMGIGSPTRATGVVSTYRLGGHHASDSLVTRRACQVALHELGHAFGLAHCRTPRCIMNDAEGLIGSVDRSTGEYCSLCRRKLDGLLRD